MKKSVYELNKKETDDYMKEFSKTEFASKILNVKKESRIFLIIILIMMFVLAGINVISEKNDPSITDTSSVFNIVFWLSFIFYFGSFVVLKLTFYRWLKIKHNIEY